MDFIAIIQALFFLLVICFLFYCFQSKQSKISSLYYWLFGIGCLLAIGLTVTFYRGYDRYIAPFSNCSAASSSTRATISSISHNSITLTRVLAGKLLLQIYIIQHLDNKSLLGLPWAWVLADPSQPPFDFELSVKEGGETDAIAIYPEGIKLSISI